MQASPGNNRSWIIIGALFLGAYGMVWMNAYQSKHALDPAVTEQVHRAGARLRVSYLFHPGDCPEATEVIGTLNELAANGEDVVGLMIGSPSDTTINEIRQAYRIGFPVHGISVRNAGLLLGALRYEHGPLAIVRDSTGVIRMLIPGRIETPTAAQIVAMAAR